MPLLSPFFLLKQSSDLTVSAKLKCRNKVMTDCDVWSVWFKDINFVRYLFLLLFRQIHGVGDTWMSLVCGHIVRIISGMHTDTINHLPDTFDRYIWMFKKCQIESYTPDGPLLRSTLLSFSDVSPGYDLRVLWRLGVSTGHTGAGWGGHHFLCSYRDAAREGRAARSPKQLLQHTIRQEPREAPT